MIKVITYGTYDLLHYGHIRLLERAKALGDYLIVGVTADDYDKIRGKIDVQQSLMERVEAVRATGLADEIIIEEYEGQKIDDIKRYNIDIFAIGSDWRNKFDYLKEYCKVIYLDRTEGISSTELRARQREYRFGLVGEATILNKIDNESKFVSGINVEAVYSEDNSQLSKKLRALSLKTDTYDALLDKVDIVYIASNPVKHYAQIKSAIIRGKHVLYESPLCLNQVEYEELVSLSAQKGVVLMEGIKTAYSTAYSRLMLLIKSGKIGEVVSVDATCTSLMDFKSYTNASLKREWNSLCAWGPTALLPIFQILGTNYSYKHVTSSFLDAAQYFDLFTKIDFIYSNAVASIKVGKGIKSEGCLIVSGTKGYAYVPAPWWKTEYFEIRYENATENKRCFYQLEGEGIRYELVVFVNAITSKKEYSLIERTVSKAIVKVIDEFQKSVNQTEIIIKNK